MSIVRYGAIAGLAWILAVPALAQDLSQKCKVLDPELQLSYEGDCVNGAAFGTGKATGKDGAWYEGQFIAGAKTGQGTKHYPTGDIYTGQWKRDKRHGYGEYEFGEGSPWRGDRYEGYWQNDLRHGTGTYIFYPAADRFEAYWENGGTESLGTTTLTRRKWMYEAIAKKISLSNSSVCSASTDGAAPGRIATGVVIKSVEDRILVEIKTKEVLKNSKLTHNPRWDVITEWTNCEPNK